MRVAVPRAWIRARRTILSADTVSFLAAAVLYYFAAGDVSGFAFTLGLSTILDLVVVFLFTHPLVSLLSRSAAFGSARFTGLDAVRDGRHRAVARRRAAGRRRPRPSPAPAATAAASSRGRRRRRARCDDDRVDERPARRRRADRRRQSSADDADDRRSAVDGDDDADGRRRHRRRRPRRRRRAPARGTAAERAGGRRAAARPATGRGRRERGHLMSVRTGVRRLYRGETRFDFIAPPALVVPRLARDHR